MGAYLEKHKKIKYGLYGLIGLLVVFFCLWQYAVMHVADIFNAIASKQPIFKGKIHAETLDAGFDGHIVFKNLVWTTDQDEPIVKIPSGKLWINPIDIITLQVSPNTIKRLEINGASLRLLFDEKWNLDIMQQDWKPANREDSSDSNGAKPQKPASKRRIKNLNLPEKLPNWHVIINNCSVEAYHLSRQYVMKDVDCDLAVSNHSKVKLQFSSGPLSGTMEGAGIDVKGETDFKANKINAHVDIKEVVPASLGVGKLSNAVTINCDFTGQADDPQVDGNIGFKTLEIRPFVFYDVKGKFHMEGDVIDITDTNGYCCGGTINATGKYNVISQRYKIAAVANNINVSELAKLPDIGGRADLNFQILTDPKHKNSVTMGHFKIGKGYAKHGHFHSVEGDVFAHNKNIYFKDVVVKLGIGHLHNHSFSIENGKFNDNPVLEDEAGIIAELSRI